MTLEDVLEEIVGEIQDEFEHEEPEIQALDPDTFIVQGKASLSDLREDLKLELPPNGADTIGGFVLDALGSIPEPGRHGPGRRLRRSRCWRWKASASASCASAACPGRSLAE